MQRKNFIKSLLGASAFVSFPFSTYANEDEAILEAVKSTEKATMGNLFGFKADAIEKVNVGIIGLGNRGTTLLQMFEWLVANDHCEVVALADTDEKKVDKAKDIVNQWDQKKPKTYSGNDEAWKKLAKQDNIDLVLIATPWEQHTPMSVFSMNHGKHVACEVPVAYTLSDCWELIETAEKNKKHLIMLENCNYNEEELFVLNMAENGVFGDITHSEGAYLHDLRVHMLDDKYYADHWRLKHHVERDGNFYTTHGLGPISFYMNIGRGDTFDHLTSMSSRELNLSKAAKQVNSPYKNFKCGDMNNTLIKTANEKTILLQFDVHTGRPYSRINKLVGTNATHDGYPSRLYIDSGKIEFGHHSWLSDKEYGEYKAKYTHPIIKKLKPISQNFKQGHGGMDFVMIYRLIRCLNLGVALDINAYDSVMWSAVTPLSEISVASRSLSVPVPDFTNGQWKKDNPLEIMREI